MGGREIRGAWDERRKGGSENIEGREGGSLHGRKDGMEGGLRKGLKKNLTQLTSLN